MYEVTELYGCKRLWTYVQASDVRTEFHQHEHRAHPAARPRALRILLQAGPSKRVHGEFLAKGEYVRAQLCQAWYSNEITQYSRKRVNAQINHLGLERTSNTSAKFNVGQTVAIANSLLATTKEFLNLIETEDGGYFFQAGLGGLKSRIDNFIQFDPFQAITSPVAMIPMEPLS